MKTLKVGAAILLSSVALASAGWRFWGVRTVSIAASATVAQSAWFTNNLTRDMYVDAVHFQTDESTLATNTYTLYLWTGTKSNIVASGTLTTTSSATMGTNITPSVPFLRVKDRMQLLLTRWPTAEVITVNFYLSDVE